MKRRIRLSESELRKVVGMAVRGVLNETAGVPSGDGLSDRTEGLRDRVRGNSKKFAKTAAETAYDMYPYQDAKDRHEAERDEQRYKRSLERPGELSKEDMDEILRMLDTLPADL